MSHHYAENKWISNTCHRFNFHQRNLKFLDIVPNIITIMNKIKTNMQKIYKISHPYSLKIIPPDIGALEHYVTGPKDGCIHARWIWSILPIQICVWLLQNAGVWGFTMWNRTFMCLDLQKPLPSKISFISFWKAMFKPKQELFHLVKQKINIKTVWL